MEDSTRKLSAKAERLRKIEKGRKEEKERKEKEKMEKEKQLLLNIIFIVERICMKVSGILKGNFIKEKDTFYNKKEDTFHKKDDIVLHLRGKDGEWKKINIRFSTGSLDIVTSTLNNTFRRKKDLAAGFRPYKYCKQFGAVFYKMSFSKFTKERFAKILEEFCESAMVGD